MWQERKSFVKVSICLLGVLLVSTACEVINPDEEIPSYVHIPAFELNAAANEGTESHNITDAWVYIDQDIQGIYELPVTFPVLAEGQHTITLRPGIKINGIASTRINYPFFEDVDYEIDFQPLSKDTLMPVTSYREDVIFEWMENFESPGISIESLVNADTSIQKVSDPSLVFEGTSSGLISLDTERNLYQGRSIDAFQLPGGLTPTYLEMDFRTNNRLVVGLIANGLGGINVLPILVLNTTEEWKKIYVNLGATVSRQSNVIDYYLYFEASLEGELEEGQIFVDNIKLIHY